MLDGPEGGGQRAFWWPLGTATGVRERKHVVHVPPPGEARQRGVQVPAKVSASVQRDFPGHALGCLISDI